MGDDAEVDVKVIKKTQETLGSIIKKPPLHEKLLKKPPFRFLHDIIVNVNKTTQFFNGLYTEEDLNSENVKDKDKKLEFLQKAIDVVGWVNGSPLSVKPSKIVAGREAIKTNEFLQNLGNALIKKKDSSVAVEKVLAGEKLEPNKKAAVNGPAVDKKTSNQVAKNKPKEKEKNSQATKPSRAPPTKGSKDVGVKREKQPSEEKPKAKEVAKVSNMKPIKSSPERRSPSPIKETIFNQSNEKTNETHGTPTNPPAEAKERIIRPLTATKAGPSKIDKERAPSISDTASKPTNTKPAPSSPKEPLNLSDFVDQNVSEERIAPHSARPLRSARSVRPTSARPAPPKIKVRHLVDNPEETSRIASAKPVSNVILDTDEKKEEEEDESFIVEENQLQPVFESHEPIENKPQEEGMLVKTILETKKLLEGGSQLPHERRKVDIDKSEIVSTQKERESANRELQNLRKFIQKVSRSANPLGKMLDYLQEDVESMEHELSSWKQEHQENLIKLSKEQKLTESILDPLHHQLDDLDVTIQDQLENISRTKCAILRNSDKIDKMLSSLKSN